MSYDAAAHEFECNGCGGRQAEPPAVDGPAGAYGRPSPLRRWLHLSPMGANAHLLHFCTTACICAWALAEAGEQPPLGVAL